MSLLLMQPLLVFMFQYQEIMGETQCLKPVAKTEAKTEVKIEIKRNKLNSELFSFTHPKMFEARSQDRSRYLSQD